MDLGMVGRRNARHLKLDILWMALPQAVGTPKTKYLKIPKHMSRTSPKQIPWLSKA